QAYMDKGLASTRKAMEQRIKKTMEEACQEVGAEGVTIAGYIMDTGNPVEKIVQRAEKGGFDLVVMGTHGHTDIDRTRLGSVAAGVVRRCPKSVLVVRLSP
ncbi:MAG: universal stress protein, partial [Pseudomonadota bacterium]